MWRNNASTNKKLPGETKLVQIFFEVNKKYSKITKGKEINAVRIQIVCKVL